MTILFNILIASILAQTSLCATISLGSHEDTKSLPTTSVELLSSFKNCIVYIYDCGYETEYDALSSTKYIQFFSEHKICAVFVEGDRQYRNYTLNKRFEKLEPHPLFTKYTTTLLNLYTPDTTSTILKKQELIIAFYNVTAYYNIPFNYVLIFMSNEEFLSIDNVGLFCQLATVSSPAVYLLILDEQEVNVVGFAHAFQSAPFLFKITKFQERYIQQLNQIIHKDFQGAISRQWGAVAYNGKCRFGAAILSDPSMCSLDVISEYLNITVLSYIDHPLPKLSISEIVISIILSSLTPSFTRVSEYNMNFVSYAVGYEEVHFVCIARLTTTGLMAFVEAYDLLTWIVAATSCVCLSGAIAALATKTTTSFLGKVQSSVPVVVMFLIERFYGYGQVIRSASKKLVLVITLWAFGAMLLGMCYSGNMVSELTSPSLPECVHDMQQLAEIAEYPILSDFWAVDENASMISYFQTMTDSYLREYGTRNGSLVPVLRTLRDKLTMVGFYSTQLNPSNYNTSSKIVLAYVSSLYLVKAYEFGSMTNSRNVRVLRGGILPFFNYWAPSGVQSNFLGRFLQTYFGKICECGMSKYWSEGIFSVIVGNMFKLYVDRGGKAQGKEWVGKSNLAVIWRKHSPELVVGGATENEVTMENLNSVFQVFGICMLLALCVFLKERRMFQLVAHHLRQMAKRVPFVVNRIFENLTKLRSRVVNRAVVAVEQEST